MNYSKCLLVLISLCFFQFANGQETTPKAGDIIEVKDVSLNIQEGIVNSLLGVLNISKNVLETSAEVVINIPKPVDAAGTAALGTADAAFDALVLPAGIFTGILAAATNIKFYEISYYTEDYDGSLIQDKGLVVFKDDGQEKSVALSIPGTFNVPSKAFDFTAHETKDAYRAYQGFPSFFLWGLRALLYSLSGYVVIGPDLFESDHAYLNAKVTGNSAINMVKAFESHFDQSMVPHSDDYYISGYSQGGHTSMAVIKSLHEEPLPYVDVKYAAMGAGPYDMEKVVDELFSTNFYLATMILGERFVRSCQQTDPEFAQNFPDSAVFNPNLDITKAVLLSSFYTPSFYSGVLNNKDHPFRKCMRNNTTDDFYNSVPSSFYHSMLDEVVPVVATNHALDKQRTYYSYYGFEKYNVKKNLSVVPEHILSFYPYIFTTLNTFNNVRANAGEDGELIVPAARMKREKNPDDKPLIASGIEIKSRINPDLNISSGDMVFSLAGKSSTPTKSDAKGRTSSVASSSGVYLVEHENEDGEKTYDIVELKEATEVDPYSILYQASADSWKLDMADLKETRKVINIFDVNNHLIESFENEGIKNAVFEFDTSNLKRGQYKIEVVTNLDSYVMPLQVNGQIQNADDIFVYDQMGDKYIDARDALSSVEVYHADGRLVYQVQNIDAIKHKLPKLPKGVYFLQVVTQKGQVLKDSVLF